jgi:hypothetical protein
MICSTVNDVLIRGCVVNGMIERVIVARDRDQLWDVVFPKNWYILKCLRENTPL